MSRRTREYLDKLMNDLMGHMALPPDDPVASEATHRAQELLAKRIHDGTATPDEYLAGTTFAAAAVTERHHGHREYRSDEPWVLPPAAADALHEFCLVVLWETVRELQNTSEQGRSASRESTPRPSVAPAAGAAGVLWWSSSEPDPEALADAAESADAAAEASDLLDALGEIDFD